MNYMDEQCRLIYSLSYDIAIEHVFLFVLIRLILDMLSVTYL